MNEQNKPAPAWRLLEPGEIVREGDECLGEGFNYVWIPAIAGLPAEKFISVRRRMEPDPVKAEMLAALEELADVLQYEWPGLDQNPTVLRLRSLVARAKA